MDSIALNDRIMRAERECEALRAQVSTLLAERGVALALVREAVPVYGNVRAGADACGDTDVVRMCDAWLARARALLDEKDGS